MSPDLITIAILIVSIVFHEVMHGWAANWLGDPTARLAGRLSLNPVRHIDPLGSIIIPAIMFFSAPGLIGKDIVFGWAKPVPYNPYNLRNQKWGEAFVAAAGPLANIFLACVFSLFIRLAPTLGIDYEVVRMMAYVVYINILLAVFNSIPFPPLDGSKIIVPFLPFGLQMKYRALTIYMEKLGLMALFFLVFLFMLALQGPFLTIVLWLYHLISGL